AKKRQQDLEQQLRLNAVSVSTPPHHVVTPIPESEDSATDSINSCSSYLTTKNRQHRHGNSNSNSGGSGSSSGGRGSGENGSGCGRPPSLALFDDVGGRERAETIV
ncbi:unnamed protein product, partial [Laminaria digitata]